MSRSILTEIDKLSKDKEKLIRELDVLINNTYETINEELHFEMADIDRVLIASRENARYLSEEIITSAREADDASSRVKELDLIKCRVSEVIELLNDIQTQYLSVNDIEAHLLNNEYEQSVKCFCKYKNTEEKLLQILKSESERGELMNNVSQAKIESLKTQLQHEVRQQFNKACQEQARELVVRFSKLFRPLDMADGLQLYIEFATTMLREELQKAHTEHLEKSAANGEVTIASSALCTVLLDLTAHEIEEQATHVISHFDESGRDEFVVKMNSIVDTYVTKIVLEFTKKSNAVMKSATVTDIQKIDELLLHIAGTACCCNLYISFVEKKSNRRPSFSNKLQELFQCYIPLQRIYCELLIDMVASRKAAASKATKPSDSKSIQQGDAAMQKAIDDLFFVLRHAIRRALDCQDASIVCSVSQLISGEILRDKLITVIISSSRTAKDKKKGSGLDFLPTSADGAKEKDRSQIIETLNTINLLERSVIYTKKLHKDFQGLYGGSKLKWGENDVKKICESAKDIMATSEELYAKLQSHFDSLCGLVLALLKKPFDDLPARSYRLSQEELLMFEMRDPWVLDALGLCTETLEMMKLKLSQSSLELFIQNLMTRFSSIFEDRIKSGKCNKLGGLQLERELTIISQYFSSTVAISVRPELNRLWALSRMMKDLDDPVDMVVLVAKLT